jgi:hypothetical protein
MMFLTVTLVPSVEHELLTPNFIGVRFAQSLVFCVVFCLFVLFLLAIILSGLRFTASD